MTALPTESMGLTRNWPFLPAIVAASLLFLVTAVAAGHNVLDLLNFNNFHEEVRALHHYDPARVNAKDYAGQYLGKLPRPVLYDEGTRLALGAGVDLVLFHKLLSLGCIILLLAGGAVIGWRLGGAVAACAVAALIALQPIYQFQVNSAVPHAWGFPLLMWGLVLLVYQRPYALALLTILSGLIYAAVTPILGLGLAGQLMMVHCGQRKWPRIMDVIVLVVTGLVSVWLVWKMLTPIEGYGIAIPTGAMVDLYPENGPDGRNFYGVFKPVSYVVASIFGQFRMTDSPGLVGFLMLGFAGLSGYGLLYLRRRPQLFMAFLAFLIPSIVICVAVTVLGPHLSYRFMLYPAFTVLPALFVCGAIALVNKTRLPSGFPVAGFVILMAAYTLSFNSFDTWRNGFRLQLDEPSNQLMSFLNGLPDDILLAAWPAAEQTDLIPYIAGKPLLVNFKAHYASHVDHVNNMRARMNDLTDAYLAVDLAPIIKLRCKWQVEFMVVDRLHFTDEDNAPRYMAPFKERIEDILSNTDRSDMFFNSPPRESIVFEVGKFVVVDLAKLSAGKHCAT